MHGGSYDGPAMIAAGEVTGSVRQALRMVLASAVLVLAAGHPAGAQYVEFEPSWSFQTAKSGSGTAYVARLTRLVEGIGALQIVCDRGGVRVDLRLTRPDAALGPRPRGPGQGAQAAAGDLTFELVCCRCAPPGGRRQDRAAGDPTTKVAARAAVVQRTPRTALLRVTGDDAVAVAKAFAAPNLYGRVGIGLYSPTDEPTPWAQARAVYSFQMLEADEALAKVRERCPAWPK